VLYLEGTEYCFTTLTFYLILSYVVLTGVTLILHWKINFQKRAARVILDCDLYTPSSELFKELNWQTFLERVTCQKAIFMYRIINNICPDY